MRVSQLQGQQRQEHPVPPFVRMEIRSTQESDDGLIIEGSANNTQETDSYRTRFVFSDSCIAESRGGIVLFNHDVDLPIGRNLEMDMRGEHLWVRDVIEPGAVTPHGRSVPDLIKRGVLRDFSIRFDNEAEISFGRDFDTIAVNHLPEHSVVSLPSNRGSQMSPYLRQMLRSLEQSEDGREVARVFRIGFAASEGRAVVDPTPQRERKPPVDFAQRDIGPLDFQTLYNRLYDLLEAFDYWAYPVAVYEDAVVYSVRGRLYRRSFTVDDAGEVTLGDDESEVLMTFAEANPVADAADATPEVRSDAPQPDAPAADPTPTADTPAPPSGDVPVGEMTLDELREALLADPELSGDAVAEVDDGATEPADADRPLSLEELQAGLAPEPETIPTA